jgi:hypothetical protein
MLDWELLRPAGARALTLAESADAIAQSAVLSVGANDARAAVLRATLGAEASAAARTFNGTPAAMRAASGIAARTPLAALAAATAFDRAAPAPSTFGAALALGCADTFRLTSAHMDASGALGLDASDSWGNGGDEWVPETVTTAAATVSASLAPAAAIPAAEPPRADFNDMYVPDYSGFNDDEPGVDAPPDSSEWWSSEFSAAPAPAPGGGLQEDAVTARESAGTRSRRTAAVSSATPAPSNTAARSRAARRVAEEVFDPWAQLAPGADTGKSCRKPFKAARTFLVLKDAADVAHRGPALVVNDAISAAAAAEAATASAMPAAQRAKRSGGAALETPLSCDGLLKRLTHAGSSIEAFSAMLGTVSATLHVELSALIIGARSKAHRAVRSTRALPSREAGGAYVAELNIGADAAGADGGSGGASGDYDLAGDWGDGPVGDAGGDAAATENAEAVYAAPMGEPVVSSTDVALGSLATYLDAGAAGDAAWKAEHAARAAGAARGGNTMIADRIAAAAATRLHGAAASEDADYWTSVQDHIVRPLKEDLREISTSSHRPPKHTHSPNPRTLSETLCRRGRHVFEEISNRKTRR